jgi:hypothetical protein
MQSLAENNVESLFSYIQQVVTEYHFVILMSLDGFNGINSSTVTIRYIVEICFKKIKYRIHNISFPL